MKTKYKNSEKIKAVEQTDAIMTGRGGMVLFVRYLNGINIYPILMILFGGLRKNKKGIEVWNIFKQVFCNFYDGSSRHLTYYDRLKQDEGYRAIIENTQEEMVSSHQIKRFYKSFSWLYGKMFRKVLKELFIWRLKLKKPEMIELTLDTMVMSNDEAEKRHGVQPTYKKVKGFQPLQLIWERKIVDAIFRGGKKHSNFGNTTINMITEIVELIRKRYSKNITIVLRIDAGFFDQKNFEAFDKLGIGFICSGKIDEEVKTHVKDLERERWQRYDNTEEGWEYIEYGYKCKSWKRFYRAIYTRKWREKNGQIIMEFARPDNIIITNIGVKKKVLAHCTASKRKEYLKAKTIIESHHQRGADELPHRGLKDFGFEEMPFKRFSANASFYYSMVIAFFLFETYKEDVLSEIMPIQSYATTVRRHILDFAARIIKRGHEIFLKVPHAIMKDLCFKTLWLRSENPPPIIL